MCVCVCVCVCVRACESNKTQLLLRILGIKFFISNYIYLKMNLIKWYFSEILCNLNTFKNDISEYVHSHNGFLYINSLA